MFQIFRKIVRRKAHSTQNIVKIQLIIFQLEEGNIITKKIETGRKLWHL